MSSCQSYPLFEPNQVLTAEQLNQLTQNIKMQQKAVNKNLVGIGIVCGFEIDRDMSYGSLLPAFRLKKGVGLSSSGDLICQENDSSRLTRYRPYRDPAEYSPFLRPGTANGIPEHIALWEALPDTVANEDETIEPLSNAFLSDKVLLLYLEVVEEDLESCTGDDCNEKGKRVRHCLRNLLLNRIDAERILRESRGLAEDIDLKDFINAKYNLPSVNVPRMKFSESLLQYFTTLEQTLSNIPGTSTASSTGISVAGLLQKLSSQQAGSPLQISQMTTLSELANDLTARTQLWSFLLRRITATRAMRNYYLKLIDPVINDIAIALQQSYTVFRPLVYPLFSTNPFYNPRIVQIYQQLRAEDSPALQYFYDFLKDLILAYEEFVEAACAVNTLCCPDANLFAKHLFLGELTASKNYPPSVFRQQFIPVPTNDGQIFKRQKAQLLFQRLVWMVLNFDIPEFSGADIRLTPSREKTGRLSDRAIPYYYGYRKNRPLHQFWNFDLALRCMSHLVPGYNAAKYEDKPAPEHVVNPLNFNLDGYNFLRIEGHIGQKIDAAFTVISDTIEQKNLPVDLMKVKMSTGNEDINVHFGCESEDLQLFYVTMCSELACLLKKEITYFSDLKYTEPRPEFEAGEISITGTVRDEKNNKLQGAQVTLQEKSLTVVTNEKGAFTIPKPGEEPATPITAGKYTLTISKGGFKTEKIAIELKTGHVLKQDIQLSTLRYYNPFEFEYAGTKLDKLTGSLYYPGTQSPGLGTAATTTTNPVPGSGVLTTPGTAIYSGSTGTPGITGSIGTTGGISSEVSGGLPMYSGVAGSERRAGSSMYPAAVAGTSTYLSGTAAAAASASQLAGQSQVLTGTAIQAEAGVKQEVFGTGKFLEYSLGGSETREYTVGNFYQQYVQSNRQKDIYGFARDYFGANRQILPFELPKIFEDKIYYPLRIVEKIEAIVETFAQDLDNFDFQLFMNQYDQLRKAVTEFEEKIAAALQNGDEDYKETAEEIVKHLVFLDKSCSLDKFNALVNVYGKRFTKLQELQQFVNYLEMHPGLEHMAGAPFGGTFVMVYDDEATVIADFALPYMCRSDCPPVTTCKSIAIVFKLPRQVFCRLEEANAQYKFILSPPGGTVSGPGVLFEESSGDYFFKPASADVDPGLITFEYGVNNTSYTLQVNVIAMITDFVYEVLEIDTAKNTVLVQFTAQYKTADFYEWDFGDGTAQIVTNAPVITHEYSDANNPIFHVVLHQKHLVCEKTAEKQVEIRACTAQFTQNRIDYARKVVVTFTAAQVINAPTEESYQWTIKTNRIEEITKGIQSVEKEFNLDIAVQTVEVTLKIVDGECSDTYSESFTLPPLGDIVFRFADNVTGPFCPDDATNYRFQLDPPGGNISGPGISSPEGEFVFTPNTVETPGKVTLQYSLGSLTPVPLEVNILPQVVAAFKISQPQETASTGTYAVQIYNQSQNANQFQWIVGNETLSGETNPNLILKDVTAGEKVAVTLKASFSGLCEKTLTRQIAIPVPPPMTLAFVDSTSDIFCRKDKTAYTFKATPAGGEVSGPGVQLTEDGTYVFIPNLVGAVGEINFKYTRGIQTPATLKVQVYDPVASFTASEPAKTEDFGVFQIILKNESLRANTYAWFLDGSKFSEQETPDLKIPATEPNKEYSIVLTASFDGNCPSQFLVKVKMPAAEDATLAFAEAAGNNFCKNDKTAYKLKVSPEGGKLTGSGTESKKLTFTPNKSDTTGPVELRYEAWGNKVATLSVRILNPVAGIGKPQIVELNPVIDKSTVRVILPNSSTGADAFEWKLQDTLFSTASQSIVVLKNVNEGDSYTVDLKAVSEKICENSAAAQLKIPAALAETNDLVIPPGGGGLPVFNPTLGRVSRLVLDSVSGGFNVNLAVFESLPEHPTFKNALSQTDQVYSESLKYFETVSEELKDEAALKQYLGDGQNEKIAGTFAKLFEYAVGKISGSVVIPGTGVFPPRVARAAQQFVYNLMLLQISQLLNLMNLQKDDLAAGSPIISTFKDLQSSLQSISSKVDTNLENVLSDMLDQAEVNAAEKSLYIRRCLRLLR